MADSLFKAQLIEREKRSTVPPQKITQVMFEAELLPRTLIRTMDGGAIALPPAPSAC